MKSDTNNNNIHFTENNFLKVQTKLQQVLPTESIHRHWTWLIVDTTYVTVPTVQDASCFKPSQGSHNQIFAW